MHTTKEKVDTSKALYASLVDTETSETESKEQDTNSRSGNDEHADNVDIRPIYDEEPMVEKCIFNANHDACVTKFLNEFNSCAKVPSNKTININKLVEQTSVAKIPERQILKGHSSELEIHDHSNELSNSKLVPKVFPPADKTASSQQELGLLFNPMYEEHFNAGNPSVSKSSALFDNLQQHDTQPTVNIHPTSEPINPPITVNAEENILILAESDSLPHANAQTTKTYYKHHGSSIKKAQVLKTKTSTYSDIKDNSSETKLRGRLLESFQENVKYEHVKEKQEKDKIRSKPDKNEKRGEAKKRLKQL
uniref:Uncharacterized protein n=1 Tax=Tanacetum cinerariifolium TaxID=118510 RepID=A0A6L2N5K6_TANCI|nr:hypothetical protein [Tanacetum cinerariifolium]